METEETPLRDTMEARGTETGAAPSPPPAGMAALLLLVDRWMAEPEIDDEAGDDLEAALEENAIARVTAACSSQSSRRCAMSSSWTPESWA